MARLVAAWAVAWAGVCLTAAAELTKIHGSLLNVCTTMGPSLTYEPVSYKLAAASEVLCAALCLEKGAQRYTTSGASCTLYGEALLAPSAAHTFLSFPSPDALEDVATGKPASGSSVHSSFVPAYAVDTNEDGSMFHSSDNDLRPWWLLDLGETRHIHDVQILSRRDATSYRLHDVEVRVGAASVPNGDFSSYTLLATYKGPYSAAENRLSCPSRDGVTGRFVSIAKVMENPDARYLQLFDVNVLVRKIITV